MKKEEKIWIASKYAAKGYSYDDLKYGDDLYNYSGDELEELMDDIWGYVTEYRDFGSVAFREKYKDHKLY